MENKVDICSKEEIKEQSLIEIAKRHNLTPLGNPVIYTLQFDGGFLFTQYDETNKSVGVHGKIPFVFYQSFQSTTRATSHSNSLLEVEKVVRHPFITEARIQQTIDEFNLTPDAAQEFLAKAAIDTDPTYCYVDSIHFSSIHGLDKFIKAIKDFYSYDSQEFEFN